MAIAEHVPMVYWNRPTNRYKGVEIGIVKALAKALNFEPVYYAVNETEAGEWEQSAHSNETHLEKGLIGELVICKAHISEQIIQ